ncbi:MAG: ribonuclease P protein component [Candidatus Beckwithbacteria bacterium]|nr:ribonuclease P protein component [Candidatus Beckwithbacteria bacterium]
MFSHAYRLPGHRLPILLKSKQSFSSQFFTLKINSRKNNQPLIGIIVPVKVSRLAVVRNRHKRLVREAIRPYLTKLKPNTELLFLANTTILNRPLSVIQADLLQLLQSCSLLN